MVGRPSTQPGGLQHEGQLTAYPFLPDELIESTGPQRTLDGMLVSRRLGGDQGAVGRTHA